MAENSAIEWCDSTVNFWIGCTKVSRGCDHCYAEVSTPARTMHIPWGAGAPRHRTGVESWRAPLMWNRQHEAFFAEHGRRRRVFAQSLSDTFDNEVPDAWRVQALDLMEHTPNIDWLVLTKRVGNVRGMVPARWLEAGGWPQHIRIGMTAVNQDELDRDIVKLLLLKCPNFLSLEPLLGPITFTGWPLYGKDENLLLHWVIVGAESGKNARPVRIEWLHDIVRECEASGVPVLVKQLGRVVHDDGMSSPGQHWPDGKYRIPQPRRTEDDPGFFVVLNHAKGGDPAEWPEGLRVRQYPEVRHA